MHAIVATRRTGVFLVAFSCALATLVSPPTRAAESDALPAQAEFGLESESSEACDPCELPLEDCFPRWTVGADYLLLRPSFSNSTALYEVTGANAATRIAVQGLDYNFGYASGVRGFLGYNFSRDTTARFVYLGINAATSVTGFAAGTFPNNGTGVTGPFLTRVVDPPGYIRSRSTVNLDVYDMELVRRFEFDPDVEQTARWDTAGSAGIRFVDTSVASTIDAICNACGNQFATTDRTFHGVGPRLALQGRRYLGRARRWSAFANGGAALLVGNYRNVDTRFAPAFETDPNLYERQSVGGVLVVPNLDISLGTTWMWRERTSISFGWMLMYWGNLGYSETISTAEQTAGFGTSVPLTNSSLAYDGAFFRLTHSW